MLSESELLEAIKASPVLRDLLDLPDRVAALEARLNATERAPAAAADPCPKCGGQLRVTDEKEHPIFGVMGLKIRTFACDACGKTVERDYDPSRG